MSDFHLLRPWWLLAILPATIIVWRLWAATDSARPLRGVVAPHLLPHLLINKDQRRSRGPLIALAACWLAAVLALTGPSWQREPAPFADDTAVLAVVLKVTSSMQTEDIQPTRLARATQKIHDLLALRPGAKTALVAYSGSAHQVMPLTTDAGIIDSFAGELDPSIMPSEGDAAAAALKIADAIVARSGQRGWVLWIADSAAEDQRSALKEYRGQQEVPVTILASVTEGAEFASLQAAAAELDANLVRIAPDDADVQQLSANTHFSSAADAMGERWRDAGYWFLPVLALGGLLWFRRGWVLFSPARTVSEGSS